MDNQTKKLLIVVGVALAVLWIAKPKNNIIDSARGKRKNSDKLSASSVFGRF